MLHSNSVAHSRGGALHRAITGFGVALLAVIVYASAAHAATAVASASLNVRSGPSTKYAVVARLPAGAAVHVIGCTRSLRWCDISYGGIRGWVAGRYLASLRSNRVAAAPIVPLLGLGVVATAPIFWSNWGPSRNWNKRQRRQWRRNNPGWVAGGVRRFPPRRIFRRNPVGIFGALPIWERP